MLSIIHGKEPVDWAQQTHRGFKLSYGTSNSLHCPYKMGDIMD